MQETEEMIASAGKDKQLLVEQKEFIVQQIVKGMDTLQVKIEQMSNFSTIFMCFLDSGAVERRDYSPKRSRKGIAGNALQG